MKSFLVLSSLAGLIAASPCPYGQLAERGVLSKADAENFYDARRDGEASVEKRMAEHKRAEVAKRAEHARQEQFYKRQLANRDLDLGGGLLGGVLQPFSGLLEALDVPTPQEFSLKLIPGDDPDHQYQAPGVTDVRGMCPTLNTMANHGYIDRSGITTFAQASNACQITLGFGYDTCTVLSVLGLLTGGDIPSGKMSIGGADARVPNTLGPSLGNSRHGFFEIDNSISRVDAYHGNQANFNLARWNRLVSIAEKNNGQFSIPAFGEERVILYNEAKNDNPTFNAGVRWLIVSTAERVFIPRALPNGTHEDLADFQNVAPFYLNETFPEQWFRRGTPYSVANLGVDIVSLLAESTEVTPLGVNQGLNNFVLTGYDLGSLTPASVACLLATTVFDETPGFLSPALINGFDIVEAFLNGAFTPFFSQFNCPVTKMSKPGSNADADAKAGPSTTCNTLVNGKYQCDD